MDELPSWVTTIIDATTGNLAWREEGSLAFRLSEDQELVLAPAGAEMLGGAYDGALVFPGFQLSISGIAEVFDTYPEMHLNTQPHPNLTFIGEIDGQRAVVMVLTEPFPDDEHLFRMHPDGTWDPPAALT